MRILETPRLLLSTATEPIDPDALETAYRIYANELEGGSLTDKPAFADQHLVSALLAGTCGNAG